MAQLLMPKATAVWLVDHTTLTFEQIAEFCELHILEVQAIADGEVATGMQGLDPTANGQLSQEELDRCTADNNARLEVAKPTVPLPKARPKGARYTPISKRQDRPDAIAWLLRSYPELSDAQVSRLIGTTKPTINAVRDRTHRNIANIKPQSPVYLGLCSAADLEKMVAIVRSRSGTASSPPGPLPPTGDETLAVEMPANPAAAKPPAPSPSVDPPGANSKPEPAQRPVTPDAPDEEVSPFAAAAALFNKPAAKAEPETPVEETVEEKNPTPVDSSGGARPTAAPPPPSVGRPTAIPPADLLSSQKPGSE